jgi:hypothetical protein
MRLRDQSCKGVLDFALLEFSYSCELQLSMCMPSESVVNSAILLT